jgi:hypothetical protein
VWLEHFEGSAPCVLDWRGSEDEGLQLPCRMNVLLINQPTGRENLFGGHPIGRGTDQISVNSVIPDMAGMRI